jgi:hypothetical protein
MEPPKYRPTLPLELLAASLAARLTLDELDWLWRELAQHTEAHRKRTGAKCAKKELSHPPRSSWRMPG